MRCAVLAAALGRAVLPMAWIRYAMLACLASAWSSAATAAPTLLIDGAGQLTGAQGVEVNGASYDVAFATGTCIAIFSGCDEQADLAFSTIEEARDAGQALLAQVFVDVPEGMFDSDPSKTAGCATAVGLCTAWVPYQVAFTMGFPVDVLVVQTENWVSNTSDFAFDDTIWPTNIPLSAGFVYAVFELAQGPAPIPEPGALISFGLALAWMVLFGRRRSVVPTPSS